MTTRRIWIYWHEGWEGAPALVRRCRDSWARWNPDHEVLSLDRDSLSDHVELPSGFGGKRKDITVQKLSALARLALLSRHGGAWADATVLCTRSLDAWLEPYRGAGFFAFRDPGRDRMISNWFIAAEPQSLILKRLYAAFAAFLLENRFSNQGTWLGDRLLGAFDGWNSSCRRSLRWHSWFARKVLRVYPYFIFHYTFNRLILTDPECAALWNAARPFPAGPAHRVQFLEGTPDAVGRARKEIDAGATPMHKLNWRADSTNAYWTAILPYLEGVR